MLTYYDCKSFPEVPENMITVVLYLVGQVGKCLTPIAGKLITARFWWKFRFRTYHNCLGKVITDMLLNLSPTWTAYLFLPYPSAYHRKPGLWGKVWVNCQISMIQTNVGGALNQLVTAYLFQVDHVESACLKFNLSPSKLI